MKTIFCTSVIKLILEHGLSLCQNCVRTLSVASTGVKLRCACYVFLVVMLTSGISAQVSPSASDVPSDQQVLAFLTESIEWYRHRAAEEQLATEPVDLVFLEDNR